MRDWRMQHDAFHIGHTATQLQFAVMFGAGFR
jgi:hypothetical protein